MIVEKNEKTDKLVKEKTSKNKSKNKFSIKNFLSMFF